MKYIIKCSIKGKIFKKSIQARFQTKRGRQRWCGNSNPWEKIKQKIRKENDKRGIIGRTNITETIKKYQFNASSKNKFDVVVD